MNTLINGSAGRMKTVNHQKFLSSLSNETRASLIQRTNRHGVARLAVHWALIILFGLAIYLDFARMAVAIGAARNFDSLSFYTFA